MTQEQQPRIGIVIGSTREGRFGEKPAHWIHEIAKQRTDLAFDLIDLRLQARNHIRRRNLAHQGQNQRRLDVREVHRRDAQFRAGGGKRRSYDRHTLGNKGAADGHGLFR